MGSSFDTPVGNYMASSDKAKVSNTGQPTTSSAHLPITSANGDSFNTNLLVSGGVHEVGFEVHVNGGGHENGNKIATHFQSNGRKLQPSATISANNGLTAFSCIGESPLQEITTSSTDGRKSRVRLGNSLALSASAPAFVRAPRQVNVPMTRGKNFTRTPWKTPDLSSFLSCTNQSRKVVAEKENPSRGAGSSSNMDGMTTTLPTTLSMSTATTATRVSSNLSSEGTVTPTMFTTGASAAGLLEGIPSPGSSQRFGSFDSGSSCLTSPRFSNPTAAPVEENYGATQSDGIEWVTGRKEPVGGVNGEHNGDKNQAFLHVGETSEDMVCDENDEREGEKNTPDKDSEDLEMALPNRDAEGLTEDDIRNLTVEQARQLANKVFNELYHGTPDQVETLKKVVGLDGDYQRDDDYGDQTWNGAHDQRDRRGGSPRWVGARFMPPKHFSHQMMEYMKQHFATMWMISQQGMMPLMPFGGSGYSGNYNPYHHHSLPPMLSDRRPSFQSHHPYRREFPDRSSSYSLRGRGWPPGHAGSRFQYSRGGSSRTFDPTRNHGYGQGRDYGGNHLPGHTDSQLTRESKDVKDCNSVINNNLNGDSRREIDPYDHDTRNLLVLRNLPSIAPTPVTTAASMVTTSATLASTGLLTTTANTLATVVATPATAELVNIPVVPPPSLTPVKSQGRVVMTATDSFGDMDDDLMDFGGVGSAGGSGSNTNGHPNTNDVDVLGDLDTNWDFNYPSNQQENTGA